MNAHTKRLAFASAVAVALVGITGPASAAGRDSWAYTDPNTYGTAIWYGNTDTFEVCDTDPDGYAVQGRVWTKADKSDMQKELDGGDSGCDRLSFNKPAGTTVYIQICRYNSASGAAWGCGTTGRGDAS
ncbi:hypothetical protein ACFPM3_06325 [Streptomyces coeruleoprunus]|uniref:Secreted protein n=1 Tax=Streptomyces coeruleoprunus TaxID=285563 RepID=A0ABV9X8H3_9ACTN